PLPGHGYRGPLWHRPGGPARTRAVGPTPTSRELADPRSAPLSAPGDSAIRSGRRSLQDRSVSRGIANGPDAGQRVHGGLQPGEVPRLVYPEARAVDRSESGGPGACDSPGHGRTAGDQPDGGAQAKRGPSPGNQRSQEGTAQIHPPAGPQDLLGGTG